MVRSIMVQRKWLESATEFTPCNPVVDDDNDFDDVVKPKANSACLPNLGHITPATLLVSSARHGQSHV